MKDDAFNGLPYDTAAEPKPLGYQEVVTWLDESAGMYALRSVVDAVTDDEGEYTPTPLVRLLAAWIQDAGLEDIEKAIRLGRGFSAETGEPFLIERGAIVNDYHLRRIDDRAPFSNRWLWRLEGAVNRFYHLGKLLGDEADTADEDRIAVLDEALASGQDLPMPPFSRHGGNGMGEWEARRRIAEAVTSLIVPLGFRLGFRMDEAEGVVAFSFMVPNAEELPDRRYDLHAHAWMGQTVADRNDRSFDLAQRLGICLASLALAEVAALTRVTLMAFPHSDADDELAETSGAEFPVLFRGPFYYADLDRAQLHDALAGSPGSPYDPQAVLEACGMETGDQLSRHRPFEAVEALPSSRLRSSLPEIGSVTFDPYQRTVLGCDSSEELRISSDSIVRHAAVSLAGQLTDAHDAQEAIALIRQIQEGAVDPAVYAGCNRLMEAFLKDAIDIHDENLVVTVMMPQDPCETANIRAESARRMTGITGDAPGSDVLAQLLDAVEQVEAGGRLQDTPEVVHRAFETYSQRVLYNLDVQDVSHPDHGRQPIPAPASVCYSYLNIADIHARHRRINDAKQWCYRAIGMAPTNPHVIALAGQTVASLGRFETAQEILETALSWCTTRHDAADVYYQLGTIAWQAGDARLGSACLQRAAKLSSLVAPRALNTQWALAKASGGFPAPYIRVDEIIEEAGLPLMPDQTALDALEHAARAMVNANIFRGALDVLGDLLRTREDPILWAIANSLYQTDRLDIDNIDDLTGHPTPPAP